MKRKNSFLLIVFIFCSIFIFAQNKKKKPENGKCNEVIHTLNKIYKNDSIAFEVFKNDYQITNMDKEEWYLLLKKNYTEVIKYFNSEEGKKYFCHILFTVIDSQKEIFLLDNSLKSKK